MPRFFIDTSDGITSRDDVGYDLPSDAALLRLVRRTLAEMLRNTNEQGPAMTLRADVRDAAGAHRLSAVLTLDVDFTKRPAS